MIRRHSKGAIFIHWFNAFCWIMLLFTGFALLSSASPLGGWWTNFWKSILGGDVGLLVFHVSLAITWIVIYAIYIILAMKKDIIPFLKEIFHLKPVEDMIWCFKKGMWLIFGAKTMRKMGIDPELPKQGFYNAGQKYVAIAAVFCSLTLVFTGILLIYSRQLPGYESFVQWSLLIHFACAGVMAIALPIHIYMAAAAPGEGPALRSMFTGYVPEEHIKHHNPLWYDELKGK